MHTRLALTAGIAGICLATLGAALPATAATTPSSPVATQASRTPAPTVDGITMGAGSTTMGIAKLSGVPFATFEIRNAYGAVIGSKAADPTGTARVTFAMTYDLIDPRLFVTQGTGDDISPVTEARVSGSAADDLAQPKVTLTERNGLSIITATAASPQTLSTMMIRDAKTNLIAQISFHGDTATYATRTPNAAKLLRVSLRDQAGPGYDRESIAQNLTLAPTAGSVTPSAPTVDGVTVKGTTAVVDLTAAPGALVTIKDSAGSPLAVRMVGASGTVSIPLRDTPAGAKRTATQSTGSFDSDPAVIAIP